MPGGAFIPNRVTILGKNGLFEENSGVCAFKCAALFCARVCNCVWMLTNRKTQGTKEERGKFELSRNKLRGITFTWFGTMEWFYVYKLPFWFSKNNPKISFPRNSIISNWFQYFQCINSWQMVTLTRTSCRTSRGENYFNIVPSFHSYKYKPTVYQYRTQFCFQYRILRTVLSDIVFKFI